MHRNHIVGPGGAKMKTRVAFPMGQHRVGGQGPIEAGRVREMASGLGGRVHAIGRVTG